MNHRARFSTILLCSVLGCAAQLRVQGGATGASVSARAEGPGVGLAAGLLGAGLSALAEGGSSDSQATPGATVHTEAVGGGVTVSVRGVALIDDATGRPLPRVEGGSLTLRGVDGVVNGATVASGSLRVRADATAGRWVVQGGEVSLSTGRTVRVQGGGALEVEVRAEGCVLTRGEVVAEAVVPRATEVAATPAGSALRVGLAVQAPLVRVTLDGGNDVLGGGVVRLDGAPDLRDLRVIDGRVDVRAAPGVAVNARAQAGTEVRWEVRGGLVLLEDGRGRRWRCRVEGGALRARTEGANPEGVAVWTPSEATLRITISVQGDMRLALTGDAPSVPLAASPVALSQRVMGALDALILAAPEGSVDALRLASAVQVTIRQTESADPALYAVPVRGRSVALLLDVSYSMRDVDPAAIWFELGREARPTKLDVARAELVKVLASLPEGTTANVIAFSSSARSLWPAPQVIDAAHLDEAIRWLVSLRPTDETRPESAIELAASMQPEQIVMISDGRPSGADDEGRSLLGFVQGISVRMRLDVVGIGPDQDREFLAALATSGRGSLRVR